MGNHSIRKNSNVNELKQLPSNTGASKALLFEVSHNKSDLWIISVGGYSGKENIISSTLNHTINVYYTRVNIR